MRDKQINAYCLLFPLAHGSGILKIKAVVYPALGSPKSKGPPEEPTVAEAEANELDIDEGNCLVLANGDVGLDTVDGAGVKLGRGGGSVSHDNVLRHAARRREKEAEETGSCADV